ncbi:MAG: hypothetical protein ACQCN3_02500 [Candidatus Bathyarchaeia archaeon]|jgi:rubrerythrin
MAYFEKSHSKSMRGFGKKKNRYTDKVMLKRELLQDLKNDQSDESIAGPDYRGQAGKLDDLGFTKEATQLRGIAGQEDRHEKIVEQVIRVVEST